MNTILLDDEDKWLLDVLPWRITPRGYVEATQYDGAWRKTVKLHHFITGTPIWAGDQIDHANRNKLDNRRCNLRWSDGYQNRLNSDYVTKAKNIRETYDGKFEVRIQRNGVLHQVGTFNTMQEALGARDSWFRSHTNP